MNIKNLLQGKNGDRLFELEHCNGSEKNDISPVYQLLRQMEELASRHVIMQEKANAKNQMLRLVSHDLISPINAIAGYLDLMKLSLNTDADPDQISTYRDQIKNGLSDLSNIVQQLREMREVDNEEEVTKACECEVDLNWVTRHVCDIMEGAAIASEHKLDTSFTSRPVFVRADISQLKRILYNLISNSVKYTPKGGNIRVYVRATQTEAQVHVVDNGVGIAKEELKNIFKPGNGVSRPDTEKGSSSGLGLYISTYFAALMNGHITLKSEVDEGSQFTLHLPHDSKHAAFFPAQ